MGRAGRLPRESRCGAALRGGSGGFRPGGAASPLPPARRGAAAGAAVEAGAAGGGAAPGAAPLRRWRPGP